MRAERTALVPYDEVGDPPGDCGDDYDDWLDDVLRIAFGHLSVTDIEHDIVTKDGIDYWEVTGMVEDEDEDEEED